MNIFVSDADPVVCARNLDDKRVRHMPKESFEMISMAYYKRTGTAIAGFIIWNREKRLLNPDKFNELFYHRCTNWVASKTEHLVWLWDHAIALLNEYEYRFNEQHYLKSKFIEIAHYIPINKYKPKRFVNATPFNEKTVFDSYKEVLNYKWFISDEIMPVLWTNRDKPIWAKAPVMVVQGNLFHKNLDFEESNFEDLPF